jgi:hypothetical protein
MSRKTAVTESISYQVDECHVCRSEVGLGANIPDEEPVEPGLAVLVGDGAVSISEEHDGNWDVEVEFTGEQSDTDPPTVTGHILCTECVQDIHNYSPVSEHYRSSIPNKLVSGAGSIGQQVSNRSLAIIFALALLLLLLFII